MHITSVIAFKPMWRSSKCIIRLLSWEPSWWSDNVFHWCMIVKTQEQCKYISEGWKCFIDEWKCGAQTTCVISLSRLWKSPWWFILSSIQSIKVQLTYWKYQVYFKFNCLIWYRKQKMKCIAQLLQRAAICTGIKHSYSKATAVSNSKFTQLIACWNGIYNGFLVFQW